MIIDGHTHVASLDTERYPLQPTGVGSGWFTDGFDVHALLAAMDGAGVDRAVVVQAVGAYGYDCRYAVDAVASAPDRLALVSCADPDRPDVPGAATAFRVFGVGATEPTWLTDGRGEAMWALAHEHGVGIVPVLWARDLPKLRPLVEAHPDVVLAVDHCGFPDPPDEPPAELLALADLPAVHLKVSTHVLEPLADPAAFVTRLAEVFGADRLCWGSDFPQTQSLAYPDMVALAHRAASGLDAAGQDAFLWGTATRLWFR